MSRLNYQDKINIYNAKKNGITKKICCKRINIVILKQGRKVYKNTIINVKMCKK